MTCPSMTTHPERPAIFDFFEGMAGNGLKYAFQDAYERSTETPWPLAPREADPEFMNYQGPKVRTLSNPWPLPFKVS